MKVNRVGILKKFVVVAIVCNFLVLGSAWIKPLRVPLYAEGEIDAGNTKSIFVNTAFIVMGALGLKIVASANGLAQDFANSLGDMFDSWTAVGSIPLATITSALQNRLNIQGQTLVIGGDLYNQIINFLNYCGGAVSSGVTSIFNTDVPAFVYDTPSSYYLPTGGLNIAQRNNGNNYRIITNTDNVRVIFTLTYSSGTTQGIRVICASLVGVESFRYVNAYNNQTYTYNLSSTTWNGVRVYQWSTIVADLSALTSIFIDYAFDERGMNSQQTNNNYYYYLFGAGAVAGTDGTISIPDPISRNYNDVNSKPFTGVGENDDVPIAIPGSFATDYPLTGTWDIPDSLPFAIPWVLDVPSALDTPIDIPWYPDPIGDIPATTIPAPPSLTDVPLIITPECENLSACLIQGVSTVSNHISQFINIHEEFRNYTIITLLIGFALFILGVFA